ncbi:TRAP transporter substrate-binding protein [Thermodesulfobacteriota bacterium]
MIAINRRFVLFAITLAITACFIMMNSTSVFAKKITIKIANVDTVAKVGLDESNGEFSSQDIKCQSFKRFIEESSGGRIEVKNFPNAQMGGEREMWEMTKQGSLEMNACSTAPLPNFVPEVMAIHIPYIFKDSNIALKVMEGPFGKELNDLILKKMGVRVLQWQHETEYNFMTVNKSVRVPTDLKGLKIRVVENPAIVEIAKLCGAAPTPIPYSEVYTSLQQGVVDGVSTGIVFIKGIGVDKLLNHLNAADPWMGWGVICINEKFYQSLSPGDQYLVKEAAARASQSYQGMAYWGRDLWLEYFKKQGKDVQVPDAATKATWVKTLKPHMTEFIRKEIGSEWVDKVIKASEQAEKELYGN